MHGRQRRVGRGVVVPVRERGRSRGGRRPASPPGVHGRAVPADGDDQVEALGVGLVAAVAEEAPDAALLGRRARLVDGVAGDAAGVAQSQSEPPLLTQRVLS